MVFRRDSKVDAFQRQISALRNQLGGESEVGALPARDLPTTIPGDRQYGTALPDLDMERGGPAYLGSTIIDDARDRQPLVEQPPAIPAIDAHTSVISHSTAWNGSLESSGALHVHGRVEGSLTALTGIFIAEEAEVDAQVVAATVTVAGSVRGTIQCTDRFELLPRGRVVGDICAPIVVIHEGGLIAGDIAMAVSNDAKTAITSSTGARMARGGD